MTVKKREISMPGNVSYLKRLIGVGWKDDDARNVRQDCPEITKECAEERNDLTGAHGERPRHRRPVVRVAHFPGQQGA